MNNLSSGMSIDPDKESQEAFSSTETSAPGYPAPLAMSPVAGEEVTHRIVKEGISFIFEYRSLSAVVRFVYTPISGTFSDIELEINNADPILPADDGGITIEMGGKEWTADSEDIERHFVSCEQIGECVEARWRWKYGEELADFLYRFTLEGKSLIVEIEGGHGKATGVDLGRVSGATHPRLIPVPYFSLGEGGPHILCTSDVFVSSLIDWTLTQASILSAPDTPEARGQMRLNRGCSYLPLSDGKRHPLRERWVLTVSRHFEEVLPAPPQGHSAPKAELKSLVWFNIPYIPPGEESYVELYELLRTFKQWGLNDVLVNHPPEVWHDGDGNATLTLEGAPEKGGDDALSEYLEAVSDLGFPFSLPTNYREISSSHPSWKPEMAALLPDGNPAPTRPGQYLLKPEKAVSLAAEHTRGIAEKFHNPAIYITDHASLPPGDLVDFDKGSSQAGRWQAAYQDQRAILSAQPEAQKGLAIGEGGMHWLYPGLLNGYLARQTGKERSRIPFLVDFDLRYLHPFQIDAGVGTIEQYFGDSLTEAEKHSRSPFLDRYISATVAYGHAGTLPDPSVWGIGSAVKTYYLLRKLQTYYLGISPISIRYHHEGNLLETSEALLSSAYEHSQLQIEYANGLCVYVNGSWETEWRIERDERSFVLPPGSFLASGPDDLLVYSADAGEGRIDYASCSEYLYCDTRGTRIDLGPLVIDGAALVIQEKWSIDVFPIDCHGEIEVQLSHFWPSRRLPPLRVLAFRPEEEASSTLKAAQSGSRVRFHPSDEFYRYRITLPEWMVEPGH